MNYYSFVKLSLIILIGALLNSCIISSYDEPCSISGKVKDSTGKGILNVSITSKSNTFKDSIKTSSDGSYKINFISGGTVDLIFSKNGYTSKSSNWVLLGGEKKILDLKMNALSEDAYFNVRLKEKTILNTGETFLAGISTNVSYVFESKATWITCMKYDSELTIRCDSNETTDERNAIIILRAEYNHTDTIRIKQIAGPILRVLDYLGKNNTIFPQTKPFVTFSREINVLTATGSNENLPFEISADKKTVNFTNIKLNVFSKMPIHLTVKASDGILLNFDLNLKLFINSQADIPPNSQSSIFTSDHQFVWICSSDMRRENIVLKQYSTNDFSEIKQILNENFNTMCYNPYNNCLYLIKQVYLENRYFSEMSLYDASTGIFKNKITIDYNGILVNDIKFSDNGYGIMFTGQNLYYIDASNNHKFGVFPESSTLYDKSHPDEMIPSQIEMCNNNKVFLLYGQNSSGVYYAYTINPITKVLNTIYSSNNMNFVTSNSGPYALYFSRYNDKIICQNVNTTSITTLNLPSVGVGNLAILVTEKTLPEILTSDVSLISASDKSIHNFSHQSECYNIKSSNDGKLVLINNNGTVFLFQSEMFTKYNNYIK